MSIRTIVTEGYGAGGSIAGVVLSGFAPESGVPVVVDTTPPVLALLGANPVALVQGQPFVEPGFTAVDDVDGVITNRVIVSGVVNPYAVGEYTLTYSVSDIAGNTTTRTRSVVVSAPVVVPPPLPPPSNPMTPLEAKQQQLVEIRAAISKILSHGQSYTVMDGGAQRQLSRASLKTLMEREKQLEREIERMSRSGIVVNYGMPR